MRESRVNIIEVDRTSDPFIVFLEDLDGPISVTNDAENVLRKLKYQYGPFVRVVYTDTEGEWWEMYEGESTNWMNKGMKVVQFKRWHGKVWDILSN